MTNYVTLRNIDRRTTLKWLAAGLGSSALTGACGSPEDKAATRLNLGKPRAISGVPYGADPDMIEAIVTWDWTMSDPQRQLVAALSDVVLPATEALPSGSAVGVPDFIDEWVSSPYEKTQEDRTACFALFEWLENEAIQLGAPSFYGANLEQQKTILDRIAWRDRVEQGLETQALAFGRFRYLAASAYFASEEGSYWLGYRGNEPSMGDYAGPSDEALSHLASVLQPLGLDIPEGL